MTTTAKSNGYVIYASNMISAQAVRLDADAYAVLLVKADRFRALTGTTELTDMNVPVVDPRTGATIGQITYRL